VPLGYPSFREGVVLMRSPFNIDSIGMDIGNTSVWKNFPAAQSGWYETASAIDGIKRLYTFQRIGEQPLLVINGLSLHTIYAGRKQGFFRLTRIALLVPQS
jgi:hypothetical protein